MKRLMKRMVLLAIVLAALGLVALPYVLGTLVRTAVNEYGPRMAKVDITLGKVTANPFSGIVALAALDVGNPAGFSTDRAFRLDEIRIEVEPLSVLGEVVTVREFVTDGAEITYEMGPDGANLVAIQKNVQKSAQSGDEVQPKPAAEESDDSAVSESTQSRKQPKPQKKIVVEHFVLKNCMVRLSGPFLQGKTYMQPLPEMELKDIGKKEGGQTVSETLEQISSQIVPLAIKTARKNRDLSVQILEGIANDFKDSGGEKSLKQILTDNKDKIVDETREAVGKLQEWIKKQ